MYNVVLFAFDLNPCGFEGMNELVDGWIDGQTVEQKGGWMNVIGLTVLLGRAQLLY